MGKRLGNRPERQRSNVKWRSTQRTTKEVKSSQARSQSHIFADLHRSSLQTNLALCDFLTFPSHRPYASNAAFNGSWWLFWWLWPFIIHTDQMCHTSPNSSSTFHPPFSQLLTFKSCFPDSNRSINLQFLHRSISTWMPMSKGKRMKRMSKEAEAEGKEASASAT